MQRITGIATRTLGTYLSLAALVTTASADEVKLVAGDTQLGDAFGSAAALSGDTALIGAPGEDARGADAGAVYVYRRTGTVWAEVDKLVAPDGAAGQRFGASVALEGTTALVGAPGDGAARGAAYVWTYDGTSWSSEAKLVALDGAAGDELGAALALDGGVAAVGAPGDDLREGAVYTFARGGTMWSETQKLAPGNSLPGDELGVSVDLDGGRLVAGAWLWTSSSGRVYVYEHAGTAWTQTAQLSSTLSGTLRRFGKSVAVRGSRIVVGAASSIEVFSGQGSSWSLEALLGGRTSAEDFARTLALNDDWLAAGNPLHPQGTELGAVHVWARAGTDWTLQPPWLAPDRESGDRLGSALALDADTILVGAPLDDDACPADPACDSGSAWVRTLPEPVFPTLEDGELTVPFVAPDFDALGGPLARSGDTLLVAGSRQAQSSVTVYGRSPGRGASPWVERTILFQPDPGLFDGFGAALAIDGDIAVVGALDDDTLGGIDAGSAYVFVRSGSAWSLEKKLTASNGSDLDRFGASVALDGDRLFVGAIEADTADGFNRGAVYVFTRGAGAWPEERILKAASGQPMDFFGAALDVEGTTLAIGSWGVDPGGAVDVVDTSTWAQTRLLPGDPASGEFGRSVDLSGDRLAIGAPGYDGSDLEDRGAVFVLARSGTSWLQEALVTSNDEVDGERFGFELALEGDTLLVGAPGSYGADDVGGGAALVHALDGATWFQRRRLTASARNGGIGASLVLDGRSVLATGPAAGSAALAGVLVFEHAVPFPTFCDASDGSLVSCPCGNAGAPDTGCDIGQGTGGVRLDVLAQETAPTNRLTLQGSGYPPALQPAAIVIRATGLDPNAPVVFGDGLRCVGVPVVRLGATFASGGVSLHATTHTAMGGAGDFHYQAWFRNAPAMFCGPELFNLSNGVVVPW